MGPGTVVTCARAGAEFELNLTWALIFASVLAYILQEGTARLTIVSDRSLGQCLRIKYRNTYQLLKTAWVCWLVAICVWLGNTFYETNNFAGGIAAIMLIPGLANTTSPQYNLTSSLNGISSTITHGPIPFCSRCLDPKSTGHVKMYSLASNTILNQFCFSSPGCHNLYPQA